MVDGPWLRYLPWPMALNMGQCALPSPVGSQEILLGSFGANVVSILGELVSPSKMFHSVANHDQASMFLNSWFCIFVDGFVLLLRLPEEPKAPCQGIESSLGIRLLDCCSKCNVNFDCFFLGGPSLSARNRKTHYV